MRNKRIVCQREFSEHQEIKSDKIMAEKYGLPTSGRLEGKIKLELLPNERGPMICKSPATSTVTFYRGSTAGAEQYLRKRVAAIVNANPWLASLLDKDPNSGEMAAYYPSKVDSSIRFKRCENVQLSLSNASYHTMVTNLGDALCKTSEQSLKTETPLWQVSLIPDKEEPEQGFALIVSCNHSLLDGHGFYKIYNMLSNDAEVESLSPVRKQELPSKILESMGGEPSLMTASPPGFLLRFIGGMLRNALFPTTKSMGFYVDQTWIDQQKSVAQNDEGNGVQYVSTNDILVSSFFKSCEADCASMAINFRGKVDDCGECDVGNYEELITYMPADFATPFLVRKSVTGPTYVRAAIPHTKMPTNWQHLGAKYGVITNWATFVRPLEIDGTQEMLHLPLFDFPKSTPASVLGAMVIFKPDPSKKEVACLCGGSQKMIDRVKASGMVGLQLGIEI